MGNEQSSCSQSSSMVYRKLSKELPPVKIMEYDENWINKDMGWQVFSDDKDREQFIRKCSDYV